MSRVGCGRVVWLRPSWRVCGPGSRFPEPHVLRHLRHMSRAAWRLCGAALIVVAVGLYADVSQRAALQQLPHMPASGLTAGGAMDQPPLPANDGETRFEAKLLAERGYHLVTPGPWMRLGEDCC